MADIKWSAFPTETTSVAGDTFVGLHLGANYQITKVGVPNGGSGNETMAAYELIAGGTTSTGAYQSIASGSLNQALLSGGAGALPSFSTATYPATTTINQILYSSANNTISGISSAPGSLLISNATSVPSWLANPTATGKILTSVSGNSPVWSTTAFPVSAGTAGTILRSNGTDIVNSTATFADTYAASTLLYSNGTNTVTGLATANSAILVTSSSGVPAYSGTMTNGQLIIGSTGATPTAATLTAGSGIKITNAAASITIASTTGGLSWSTVSGTSQSITVNSGYIVGNASLTTFTLPSSFAIGDTVIIKGLGAAGWILTAFSGTTIQFGSVATSSGGSLQSNNQYDTVKITGLVANTTWSVDYALSSGLIIT